MTPRPSRRGFVLGAIGAGASLAMSPRIIRADPLPMPASVRAIYLNPLATTEENRQGLLDLIDASELNALVIDVKEDGLYVPTRVPLFTDAGEVDDRYLDALALLDAVHARGIYAIARVVTFRDAYIARTRPDLAMIDALTGEPWQSYDGLTWLNPLKEELWSAYREFAKELVALGFDEVQFDYVRFPSDGDLTTLDAGVPLDEPLRASTIADFLGSCRQVIAPLGAATAADIFGYTLLVDDIGIGQNAGLMADQADVLCPMVYPSHYPDYSILVPGPTLPPSPAQQSRALRSSRLLLTGNDLIARSIQAYRTWINHGLQDCLAARWGRCSPDLGQSQQDRVFLQGADRQPQRPLLSQYGDV